MKKGRVVRGKSNASAAAKKKSSRTVPSVSRPAQTVKKSTVKKPAARKKVVGKSSSKTDFLISARKAPARSAAKRSEATYKDLPYSYNETRLALLVRDTEWGYSYWDFSGETWHWIESFFNRDPGVRARLRIHQVDTRSFHDLDIHLDARNWYIHFAKPDTSFEAELGLVDSNGKFHRIALSNRVRTPRSAPSQKVDPSWNPENFDELYKISGGGHPGAASELSSTFKRPASS